MLFHLSGDGFIFRSNPGGDHTTAGHRGERRQGSTIAEAAGEEHHRHSADGHAQGGHRQALGEDGHGGEVLRRGGHGGFEEDEDSQVRDGLAAYLRLQTPSWSRRSGEADVAVATQALSDVMLYLLCGLHVDLLCGPLLHSGPSAEDVCSSFCGQVVQSDTCVLQWLVVCERCGCDRRPLQHLLLRWHLVCAACRPEARDALLHLPFGGLVALATTTATASDCIMRRAGERERVILMRLPFVASIE